MYTSWAVFRGQFEAVADHNDWRPREKAAHLLSVLRVQAAFVSGALKGRCGDHRLAAAYRSHLKARFHKSSVALQEFAVTVKHLAHRTLSGSL
jgi:hypothetical protein